MLWLLWIIWAQHKSPDTSPDDILVSLFTRQQNRKLSTLLTVEIFFRHVMIEIIKSENSSKKKKDYLHLHKYSEWEIMLNDRLILTSEAEHTHTHRGEVVMENQITASPLINSLVQVCLYNIMIISIRASPYCENDSFILSAISYTLWCNYTISMHLHSLIYILFILFSLIIAS